MEVNKGNIKQILKRYYAGDTSLKDEEALKNFFKSKSVPEEYEADKVFFQSLEADFEPISTHEVSSMLKVATGSEKIEVKPKRLRVINIIAGISIAATLALTFGIGWILTRESQQQMITDTYTDPMQAYHETQRLLMLVSSKINSAYAHLEPISKLDLPAKSLEQLNQISRQMNNLKALQSFSYPAEVPIVKEILYGDSDKKK
jgi:hypothetical protein